MEDRPSKKRGVIYKRVSTDDQRDHGYSLQAQENLLREKMKQDGVSEVTKPVEDVESGMGFDRPGLKKLLELAHSKQIDFVYVYSLDRLGRHVVETLYYIYRLREEGVIVRDINEEYILETPIHYAMLFLKLMPGHEESLNIGKRTQMGKVQKFLQGKWVGTTPFGYRKNDEGALEKRSELVSVVIDIFQTYKSTHDVKVTTRIINSKYSAMWGSFSPNQIRAILSNPLYVGRPKYGENQILMEAWAIVDSSLFDEVQRLLGNKGKKHKAKEKKNTHSELYDLVSDYGGDYVMRTLKLLKPHCPKCGSLMVRDGHKLVEGLVLQNFTCTHTNNKECKYQRTIPQAKEVKQFFENVTRCPVCGVVEDFVKTDTLGNSTLYNCKRCTTSFQIAKRVNENDETVSSDRNSELSAKSKQFSSSKEENNSNSSSFPLKNQVSSEVNGKTLQVEKTEKNKEERPHDDLRKNKTLDDFGIK